MLSTPDLCTAGLGVSRARACVTQASPGVFRPHSASLPCSAWVTHDSRLSQCVTHVPGERTLGPPLRASRTRNQVLETLSEGLPLRRLEAGRASPFVGHCESHWGCSSSISELTDPPPAWLREHNAPAHQPTESFGRAYRGSETVKIVFLFISSRGFFFDSQQVGTP